MGGMPVASYCENHMRCVQASCAVVVPGGGMCWEHGRSARQAGWQTWNWEHINQEREERERRENEDQQRRERQGRDRRDREWQRGPDCREPYYEERWERTPRWPATGWRQPGHSRDRDDWYAFGMRRM